MRKCWSILILLCTAVPAAFCAEEKPAVAAPAASASQPAEPVIVIENLSPESEVEHDFEGNLWIGRYGVKVNYGPTELIANQVVLSQDTGDVIADGNVRLRNEGNYWTGDHLEYNLKLKKIKSDSFRAGYAPFYVKGIRLDATTDDKTYTAQQALITSDDVTNPTFKIRAKSMRIRLGESIDATNATVYFGRTPVMYLPKYHRNLHKHSAYWSFTPGYRSRFGPYLLSSYHFPITTNIEAAVNMDLYQKRGLGFGPDLAWDFGKWSDGLFRYWYIRDNLPGTDPEGKKIRPDRHRIMFWDKATLNTNLTAKIVVNQQTDPQVIRDFFETEYRRNSQPRSFAEVDQLWKNWGLNVMAQPQINNFEETVERLPDVKLSGFRQEIGASPLFYESESSAGYFRFQSGLPNGTNYAAMRADTFHQILLPQTYFGWLNFIPRMGGRFTHYGETEGAGTTTSEKERFVFNTGAEVSFKASRVYKDAESDLLDVHELRHIIEPSLNYVFVPHPTRSPGELPQFDREIPSLRLLPLDFPDYNAIDSVDSENVVRLGLRNKLQTKRENDIQNLVNWALYTDWRLHPRTGQTTFADIYSDLDIRPRSWLTFNSETRYDVKFHQFNGAYHTITIAPNDVWSIRLGHRYFRGGPEFGLDSDNNTIFSSIFYKFNENWAARMTHHFEARDGTLEEQYYTVYRDFRSWTSAFTLRLRANRAGPSDWAVAFTFQFKAFPRYKLGADRDYPSILLGS